METLCRTLDRVDRRVVAWLQQYSVPILRFALGIVFLWFGALKLVGRSPVNDLVAATVPILPPEWFVPFLGAWEVAIALGLLFRLVLRITLVLLFLQLSGTFLVLIVEPALAFDGSPLVLTYIGEFVVKNVVLLAAGLVVASTVRGAETAGVPECLDGREEEA